MNGWKLTRRIGRIAILVVAGAIGACAHAPPSQEMSIVEAIANPQVSSGPASCAALNAAAVCEKTTRLDNASQCRCVDARALTGFRALRF